MDVSKIINRFQSVPDDLVSAMGKVESQAMKRILKLIDSLDVVDGLVQNTQNNLNIIKSIDTEIKEALFSTSYWKAVDAYDKEFKVQASLTNAYFAEQIEGFSVIKQYTDILNVSRANAMSLLSEDVFTQALIKPIQDSFFSSTLSGGSIQNLIKDLRIIVLGNDQLDGRLVSHVKRVAYDAFAIGNAQYTQGIGNYNNMEWILYAGGEVSDTRCFCDGRHGKIFHRKEIELWGEGEELGSCKEYNKKLSRYGWQGMNDNTNKSTIFSYRGGYNCKHSLMPVSMRRVPKEVIQKAIEKGWYEEAA